MSNSQTPEPGTERTLRSTRNPRRRARQSDQESVKSAPRRKRSKIDENTFMPPRMRDDEMDGESIEVASPKRGRGRPRKDRSKVHAVEEEEEEEEVNGEVRVNGVNGTQQTQMVMRGGKSGSVKRPQRGDGATVLAQNERYALKLLPSTPKELRREGVEYRGYLGSAHLALAVTRSRAWVWDYTSHVPVNNARVFDVPFPVKDGDVLPFGALVSSGGSSEVGMLLVHATTGKIVFYESIERAASLGLFQERNTGVEGNITGLFSGEVVTDLVSADHAGFIITLSSGRILQLTLRDAQGRARISVQFLRANEQSGGGIFGSIRGLLGTGAWKRDVAAVHVRPLGTRGQMQVLSLTEMAELQVWDLDWSGQCNYKSTVDFRELIQHETRSGQPAEMRGLVEDVTMLDFAIVDHAGGNGAEVATLGTEQPLELLVLYKMGMANTTYYMLAEISISGEKTDFARLLDLTSYHRPSPGDHTKPKLLLPKPQHTAMIAFADAIVVTSIGEQERDSPEAQLHASYVQASTFEDVMLLRPDKGFAVLGACEEDGRGSHASSIAFVQGAGLVRLSAFDPSSDNVPEMSRLPVKSKVEQAVFYGALQDTNILDFSRDKAEEDVQGEVEDAVLAISREVFRSTSKFISGNPTSIDTHLAYKAQALRALVLHVRQNYHTLSRSTMWRLLWDAERVAAAQVLWKTFEEHVAAVSKKKRTATVLDEVCATVHEQQSHREDTGDDDAVKTFFVHGLHLLEKVLLVTQGFVKMLESEDKPAEVNLRLVLEADDIWTRTIETVYSFRAANASAYGILPELIEDGVLAEAADYEQLPEFWTSTLPMLKSVIDMCALSRRFADIEWEKSENDPEKAELIEPITQKICAENPKLVQIHCNIYQERIHWLGSRPSEKDRGAAEKLRQNYNAAREDEFRALANVAQTEAGLKLAEKYRDMHTLTVMVVAEMQFCLESLHTDPEQREAILGRLNELTTRIGKYFHRFGDDWANAYFDEGFAGSKAGVMLRDAQEHWQEALTRYLRADPSRARICWIDDITASSDWGHARECLSLAAREQEDKLWNKKVELSMAKLAALATAEDKGSAAPEDALQKSELEVVDVQERLYKHMLPEMLGLIDRQAELQMAMQKYVFKNQDLHSLRQLVENDIHMLLSHKVLDPLDLIDVLTLIDAYDSDGSDDNLEGSEFYLALRVLDAIASKLPQDRFETTLQLIWKRCYVYDAETWHTIDADKDRTQAETDAIFAQTAPWRTLALALDDALFEHPDTHIRHLSPTECLGAGCRPEDLAFRWPEPDLLDPILRDNRTHDEQMQDLIATKRLDGWMRDLHGRAKAGVVERAEVRANAREVERKFEEGFVEGGEVDGAGDGVLEGIKLEEIYPEDSEGGVEESAEFDESGVGEEEEEEENGEGDVDVEMG